MAFRYLEGVANEHNNRHLVKHSKINVTVSVQDDCKACQNLLKALSQFKENIKVTKVSPELHGEDEDAEAVHHTLSVITEHGQYRIKLPTTVHEDIFARALKKAFILKHTFRPLPHQKGLVESCAKSLPPKLLLYFSMGSGKTLAILHLLQCAGVKRVRIICSNSIVDYWSKSIDRLPLPNDGIPITFFIHGYEYFKGLSHRKATFTKNDVLVVDEMQTFRTMTDAMIPSINAMLNARNTIYLSGTPLSSERDLRFLLIALDVEDDVAAKILLDDHELLLIDPEEEGENQTEMSASPPTIAKCIGKAGKERLELLSKSLTGKISHFDPRFHLPKKWKDHYPKVDVKTVEHKMSWVQTALYFCCSQGRHAKIGDMTFTTGTAGGSWVKLSLLNGIRNPVDNSLLSSKLVAVSHEVNEINEFPQIIYSRFKEKMLKELFETLTRQFREKKLVVQLLTGETPDAERDKIITRFNTNEIHMLLVCRIGSNSLDLNAAKVIHLLEPQISTCDENQIIARALRYNKTKGERVVHVRKYIVKYPDLAKKVPSSEYELLGKIMQSKKGLGGYLYQAFDGSRTKALEWCAERIKALKYTEEEIAARRNIVKYKQLAALLDTLHNSSLSGAPKAVRVAWKQRMSLFEEEAKKDAKAGEQKVGLKLNKATKDKENSEKLIAKVQKLKERAAKKELKEKKKKDREAKKLAKEQSGKSKKRKASSSKKEKKPKKLRKKAPVIPKLDLSPLRAA